jgi:hypothetical protein
LVASRIALRAAQLDPTCSCIDRLIFFERPRSLAIAFDKGFLIDD